MLRAAIEGAVVTGFEAPRARGTASAARARRSGRARGGARQAPADPVRGRHHPAHPHAHDGRVAHVPGRPVVACDGRTGRRRRADGARGRGLLRGAGGGAARRRCAAAPSRCSARSGPTSASPIPTSTRSCDVRNGSIRGPRSAWRSWTSGSRPASATSTSPRWRSRVASTRSLRSPTWIATRRADLWRTAGELLRRNLGPAPRRTTPHGLAVYDRAGRPCRVCGTAIAVRRQGEAARSTWWCPTCQSPTPAARDGSVTAETVG